jgi:hypothetical protein
MGPLARIAQQTMLTTSRIPRQLALVVLLGYACSPITVHRADAVKLGANNHEVMSLSLDDDPARWTFIGVVEVEGGQNSALATRTHLRDRDDVVLVRPGAHRVLWEGTGALAATWLPMEDAPPRLLILSDPHRGRAEQVPGEAIRFVHLSCTLAPEPECAEEAEVPAPSSRAFVTADLDADGLADIVTVDGEAVFVHRGRRSELDFTWDPRVRIGEAMSRASYYWSWVNVVTAADLDGDGFDDIIVADGSRIAIFFGTGTPGAEVVHHLVPTTPMSWVRVHAISIDDSERVHLVGEADTGLLLFANRGGREFEQVPVNYMLSAPQNRRSPVLLGHFTEPNLTQFLVIEDSQPLAVLTPSADTPWITERVDRPPMQRVYEFVDFAAVDLDGDGMTELLRSWVAIEEGCG